jgi:hypothetical protein
MPCFPEAKAEPYVEVHEVLGFPPDVTIALGNASAAAVAGADLSHLALVNLKIKQ